MRNGMRLTMCGGLVATLLCVAGLAAAQVDKSAASGGYYYNFVDDPLSAGGFGAGEATIRVRPNPARTSLIRPRTSFIPELRKSVEHL